MDRYVSNHIRLAVVKDVDNTTGKATTRWEDTLQEGPEIIIPHPYAGVNGEGIFIGLSPGSIVALDMASYERYVPVCVIPNRNNYGDISGNSEISFNNIGFPFLNSGEIAIQGLNGSILKFNDDGDMFFQNKFKEGVSISNDSDPSRRCLISKSLPAEYVISQSGISASGIVRRDVRIGEDWGVDFLERLNSEFVLEEVGWDPSKNVVEVTRQSTSIGDIKVSDNKYLRNPALAEERQIIFEYGKNWGIGTFDEELERLKSDKVVISYPAARRERKSNILSLSLTYPNELMERVNGTLVDVFGNILDINKNIISVPNGKDSKEFLNQALENMRHSVAVYTEINSRKGWGYRDVVNKKTPTLLNDPTVVVNSSSNNSRDRSRWSFKVDKEGLTTLNIPATSETGNIPFLARHETSSVLNIDDSGKVLEGNRTISESKGLYRNATNQDIFLDQFGPGGISVKGREIPNRLKGKKTSWVEDKERKLPDTIKAGTAFHDITKTANLLLKKDINKIASDISVVAKEGADAVSSEIDATLPDFNNPDGYMPNAGGRSACINLDGSLETSIGANTIDRISWTLDTAGALVARIGRDKQGRSAIVHADGYVALEIGGWDFIGEAADDSVDSRFVGLGVPRSESLPNDKHRFKGGKLVIRIRRSETSGLPDKNNADHLLIIDETGITIQSAGRINFVSDQDIVLDSKSSIMLNAPNVMIYKNLTKYIRKDGRPIS